MFAGASKFNNGIPNDSADQNSVGNPLKFTFKETGSSGDRPRCDYMFDGAQVFNAPVYHWQNTGSINDMDLMFKNANKFNQEVRTWDVTGIFTSGSPTGMFRFATEFLGSGRVGVLETPGELFWTLFDGVITDDNGNEYRQPNYSTDLTIGSNNSKLKGIISFYSSSTNSASKIEEFIGQPNSWDVSQITNMVQLFQYTTFNSPINNWDTRNVTSMNQTFRLCSFNQDISKWDTSKVTSMFGMFDQNTAFNQNINTSVQERDDGNDNIEKYVAWDVSKVTMFNYMFNSSGGNNSVFNGDISNWNTSSAIYMDYMFKNNDVFNRQIGEKTVDFTSDGLGSYKAWNVSSCDNFSNMFAGASKFNNGIQNDIADQNNVGNPLKFTFKERGSSGDPPRCDYMFSGAQVFNAPIYHWQNTGSIKYMNQMFNYAIKFNQEVRTWDVTGIFTTGGNYTNMFQNATAFLAGGGSNQWDTQNENPGLDFWKTWASYTINGVTFEPHPNTLTLT
jgi:surface protein